MAIIGMLILFLAVAAAVLLIFWTLKNGISPSPTSSRVANELFDVLSEEKLTPKPIYELGAGWGTLAFPLAQKYPDHKIHAYETSPIPYYFCLLRQWLQPTPNLFFHRQNFFQINLSNASLVVCYLYPKAMQLLSKKFKQELPADCVVVSHTFRIPTMIPNKTVLCNDFYNTQIYFYRF
jgi:hypothetical protein